MDARSPFQLKLEPQARRPRWLRHFATVMRTPGVDEGPASGPVRELLANAAVSALEQGLRFERCSQRVRPGADRSSPERTESDRFDR
ncbi:MAG: hypothetical protein K2Q09_11250 [Phycisphaerales bacterium]|nr:hypothetical protein [Phycisphaerales bacterium]